MDSFILSEDGHLLTQVRLFHGCLAVVLDLMHA